MANHKQRLPILIPAVSLALLLILFLLSGLLSLGQQLSEVSLWLGFLYWLLVILCIGAGIVWPVLSVWRRPIFSMYMLRDRQGHARQYWCRRLTANLKKNTALTPEESGQLTFYLQQKDQTDDLLIAFFCSKFSSIVDERILAAARSAFVATAVSQTALYDTLSMLSISLHQIRAIVEACGYRPSSVALLGLYVRVLKAAFLAGGMEELDLEEILPFVTGNAALKLPGLVLASAAQGTVNAFMTARVGIITKKILFHADGPVSMQQARKESYKEALALLKKCQLHKELLNMAGKTAHGAKEAAVTSAKKMLHR